MKCQDFATTINSLARGQLVEAAARAQVLAHVGQCVRCAEAWAEQCAVAAGVRAVAARLADEGASAQVEAALRRAFRAQVARSDAPASSLLLARQPWGRWVIGAAVAAAILLAFLTGMRWLKPSAADQRQEARHHPSPPAAPDSDVKKEVIVQNGAADVHEQKLVRHAQRRRAARPEAAPETEVMTSFYPLVEAGELVPLESGQVVRVEVPATTLIALGLLITAESSDRPVQADLLLGQDGLARAIRFLP